MRVLVCGGRDFNDRGAVARALDDLSRVHGPITWLIEGGARGADAGARAWALAHDVPALTYLADWATHGRRAGVLRNQDMLTDGKPDLVVAFPGGKGTADMVKRARKQAVPVVEIPAQPRPVDLQTGPQKSPRGDHHE
jgi:hypothetical protein